MRCSLILVHHHHTHTSHCPDELTSLPKVTSFVACNMSDQLQSSRIEALFESALRDYENKTGIPLAKHPLAEQLQNCQSVDSVTTLLQERARAFNEYRGSDKIMKSLRSIVSALSRVSATPALGHHICMVCPRQLIGCPMCLTPPTVVPTCACNSYWPRYPTHCMCLCYFTCVSL